MSRDELDQLQHRMFRGVVLTPNCATPHEGENDLTLIDLLADEDSIEPSGELELRELHSARRDRSPARSSPSSRGRLVPRRANISGARRLPR